MAGFIDNVDQRTRLAGHNRFELLLFRLQATMQLYGINVFKVREVLLCPSLTKIPKSHSAVRGVVQVRGDIIPVLDISFSVDGLSSSESVFNYIVVAEYNDRVLGFLVDRVERIVNVSWESVLPPPATMGEGHYLTAVINIDDELVEVLDVEKILAEVFPVSYEQADGLVESVSLQFSEFRPIVVVADDSVVARKQILKCLEGLPIELRFFENGRLAFDFLNQQAEQGDINESCLMLISDIEMPEMDGYTLTSELRVDPRFECLHVLLHTSLSGVFNHAMVERVGADDFLAKFYPEILTQRVLSRLEAWSA